MGKPSAKALGKRKAPHQNAGANKKAGIPETGANGKPKRKAGQEKKVKLRDQKVIPVPKTSYAQNGGDDENSDLDDQGIEDFGDVGGFLSGVDPSALGRSVKETKRLHELAKAKQPFPKPARKKSRLPTPPSVSSGSFDSDADLDSIYDEDMDGYSLASGSDVTLDDDEADFDDLSDEISSEDGSVELRERRKRKKEANGEADYETSGRARWAPQPPKEEEDSVEVGRLPIKLPTGEVQKVEGTTKIALPSSKKRKPVPEPLSDEDGAPEEAEEDEEDSDNEALTEKMAGQRGKFGRLGIAEIVGKSEWKSSQKLAAAKEQIAGVGAEILAGGELVDIEAPLTRLSTFSLHTVNSLEEGGGKLPVPSSMRGLAFLSQLAVFKDLIPGYRIRQLTALEEAEKVREEVRRQRDGEKMLVRTYKGYLKSLEVEVKGRTPLGPLCLRCMCDLLTTKPHFNFSENIIGVLVGRVARKSWDEDADLVLQTFITVFQQDISAVYSQTLVRLIARMVKERKFQVHPNILSCLLHLRLRSELDRMRDGKNGDKPNGSGQVKMKGKFKSEIRETWRTKNQRKKEKEMKEARKEMAEAEAEVDKEERAQVQTETLKNLFVLYFSILKHPGRTPLLASALEGISQFAHFINIDFFRDLLIVLRRIILDQPQPQTAQSTSNGDTPLDPENVDGSAQIRLRLLAIVTAFDILSGQGEALNIDLSDFVNALFSLVRPLSLDPGLEDPPLRTTSTSRLGMFKKKGSKSAMSASGSMSTSELMFKCLDTVFFAPTQGRAPPYRAGSFAKRLAECSLHLPPSSSKKALEFVRTLMAMQPQLEGMLDTEERMFDGIYKPELDDPQLVNPFATSMWELEILSNQHWDEGVRGVATKLREKAV